MRVLLTGAGGQLANDARRAWRDHEIVPMTHAELDVTDAAGVSAAVERARPDFVLNTAAYHNVDACETTPVQAFEVNAAGPLHLATACAAAGAALMHITTDYVFSGKARRAYVESDAPDPINVYGATKAAGELMVRQRLERHYIIRTSGLYGVAGNAGKGGNFVERMLQLQAEGRDLKVVGDQVLSPTYTADLAEKLLELARTERYGTYHVTNAEACSWHDFAAAIFEMTGRPPKSLTRTTTAEFASPARRPALSELANDGLRAIGIAPLRPWREALAAYLIAKGHIAPARA